MRLHFGRVYGNVQLKWKIVILTHLDEIFDNTVKFWMIYAEEISLYS